MKGKIMKNPLLEKIIIALELVAGFLAELSFVFHILCIIGFLVRRIKLLLYIGFGCYIPNIILSVCYIIAGVHDESADEIDRGKHIAIPTIIGIVLNIVLFATLGR